MIIPAPSRKKIDLPLNLPSSTRVTVPKISCPHCGVIQATERMELDCAVIELNIWQCINCRDISIGYDKRERWTVDGIKTVSRKILFPQINARKPKHFPNTSEEIINAYNDANKLFSHHAGAAGAYARRALELVLEKLHYGSDSLAKSIDLANKETDPDKKLPQRFRTKLNYIKEIGNFALHIRRDNELIIVPINKDEVEACLLTLEELILFLFEEPAEDLERTNALNEKLKASGKKPIEISPQ